MSYKYKEYMEAPTASIDITPSTSAQEINVTDYATANVSAIPVSTLDSSIISGQAYEEETGDYGWKSTVQIPQGYHNAQTLEKTFSEVFPAPSTPGTASEVLLGYQFYDKDGKVVTGTMANNGAVSSTISTQGGSYTVPAGYHDGTGTVTANVSTETKSATPTSSAQTIEPTTGKLISSVTVAAVPYTETENAAGGLTVTIL